MKNNKLLKSILGSGLLTLGSLAVFAGCCSGSGDQFSAIKTEVNNLFNNGIQGGGKGGSIKADTTTFNVNPDTDIKAFIDFAKDWTKPINSDTSKVNLSVKQVISSEGLELPNNVVILNAEVLVNDSKVQQPKGADFDANKNFANNFIVNVGYQAIDGKVTKLVNADDKFKFEEQAFGNSITTMITNKTSISLDKDYNFTPKSYFDPTQAEAGNNNFLFNDNRTAAGTDKTKPYSLPNALINAAAKDKSGVHTINTTDWPNVSADIKALTSVDLSIQIGYTENMQMVVAGLSKTGEYMAAVTAKKMSFSDLTILIKDTTQDYHFAFISDLPILNKHSGTFNFFATNVGFSFASDGTNYVGYSVGGFEAITQ